VARFVERAVAREVAPAKLPSGVFNRDRQPTGEQILTVPTYGFFPTELQGMRVAPLGRPRHHDDARREPLSFAA
jgi:hypothetical protein